MRVAKRTGHTEARATGKPRGTRPAAIQGQGVLMVTGTPEAGIRRAAVKPGHRTRAPAGARTAVPRKPAGRKALRAAAPLAGAGMRLTAAAAQHPGRRAAARRAPVPAPQASTPQVPARGHGPSGRHTTRMVSPCGQAGAAAAGDAGSARPAACRAGRCTRRLRRGLPRRRIRGRRGAGGAAYPAGPYSACRCGGRSDRGGFPPICAQLTRLASPHEVADQIRGAGCTAPPVGRSPRRWRTAHAGSRYSAARRAGAGAGTVPALRRVPRSVPEIRVALAEAIQGRIG